MRNDAKDKENGNARRIEKEHNGIVAGIARSG
jgi:hypothetical protein